MTERCGAQKRRWHLYYKWADDDSTDIGGLWEKWMEIWMVKNLQLKNGVSFLDGRKTPIE